MSPPFTPSTAHPLARVNSLQAILLLGSMGMLPTLWSDMLFPAIVSIQQDLGTSATAVQQTVSLFFIANAFMCLERTRRPECRAAAEAGASERSG